MEKPEFNDAEFNTLYKEEGEQIVADQLEKDRHHLENVRIAEKVLSAYHGWGLADAMPLGEAIGFLGEELKNGSSKMDKDKIEQTRDFLEGLIPDKYSESTELHELMLDFLREEKEFAH